MKVGSFEVLDMSQVYHTTLFGPMFYSWWNCPLIYNVGSRVYAGVPAAVVISIALDETVGIS